MRIPILPLAALLALAAACSTPSHQSVPLPDPASAVAPDACRVYILRENLVVGSLKDVAIFDDGREIGGIRPGTYLCWDRPAQRGTGLARFKGYKLDGGTVESIFDLPREGGTTHWYAIRLRRGDRKPVVEALGADEGRALIAERNPAGHE